MNVRPLKTVHKGTVPAAAYFLSTAAVAPETALYRIGALFGSLSAVHRIDDGYLLLLKAPVLTYAERAPGTVLVQMGKVLSAAPLSPGELERIAPEAGSILLCEAGEIRVYTIDSATRVDPADLVDVSGFSVVDTEHLGPRAAKIARAPEVVSPPIRTRFDKALTTPSKEKQALLEALASTAEKARRRANRTIELSASGALAIPMMPGFVERLFRAVGRALKRLFLGTFMAQQIGRKQAAYLDKMMHMFDRRDYESALRHAIPFSSLKDAPSLPPSYNALGPRADLTLQPAEMGAASSLNLGEVFYGRLKSAYRRAFEELAAAGEIRKAAFVLLELLHENEEAVAFLEQHKELRFAAEVAAARDLAPSLVVRQWFLAGEPAQAVRVARRTGAFRDAVIRLEKTHPEAANKLRLIWADTLATAGNFGAAVDALWTYPEGRSLVEEWIDRAIQGGDAASARMLVLKAVMDPDAVTAVLPRIDRLFAADDDLGTAHIFRMLKELFKNAQHRHIKPLSGHVLRRYLQHSDRLNADPRFADSLRSLCKTSGDVLLTEDLPAGLPRKTTSEESLPRTISIDATDVGLTPLFDGVLLPSGRMLSAMGEAGVQLLSKEGKRLHRFDAPAHRLIVNDAGTRVIAVAKRGGAFKLTRLNLDTREQDAWCIVSLDVFGSSYDGGLWFVGVKDSLLAVDVFSRTFEAIWSMDRLGGAVTAIERNADTLSALVEIPNAPQVWTFELPSIVLRRRREVTAGAFVRAIVPAVTPQGGVAVALMSEDDASGETIWRVKRQRGIEQKPQPILIPCEKAPMLLAAAPGITAVGTATSTGVEISIHRQEANTLERRVTIALQGAATASIRKMFDAFTIVDDQGRTIVLSVKNNGILRDFRI